LLERTLEPEHSQVAVAAERLVVAAEMEAVETVASADLLQYQHQHHLLVVAVVVAVAVPEAPFVSAALGAAAP
jgi:hypothetical protein